MVCVVDQVHFQHDCMNEMLENWLSNCTLSQTRLSLSSDSFNAPVLSVQRNQDPGAFHRYDDTTAVKMLCFSSTKRSAYMDCRSQKS